MRRSKADEFNPSLEDHLTALIDMQREDYHEAQKHIEKAIREDPTALAPYLSLVELQKHRNEPDKMVKTLESVLDTIPMTNEESREQSLRLAKLVADMGKHEKAADLVLRHLEKPGNENDIEATTLLREIYIAAAMWEKAYHAAELTIHRQTVKDEQPAAYILALMASGAISTGNRVEASAMVKRALQIYPDCILALVLSADLAADSSIEEAKSEYLSFVQLFPKHAHLVFGRLNKLLKQQGEQGTMGAVLESVLAQQPNCIFTLVALSEHYARGGDYEDASQLLQQAEEILPRTAIVARRRVDLALACKDMNAIIEAYENVVENVELNVYHCTTCGRTDKLIVWHCPKCASWGTYIPREGSVGSKV